MRETIPTRTVEAVASESAEEFYSEARRRRALIAMEAKALNFGLTKGVGFVCIRSGFYLTDPVISVSSRKIYREPQPLNPSDRGTNYFGIAMMKLAESLSSLQDSGTVGRIPKKGEVGIKGCVVTEVKAFPYSALVFTGYSGGTPQQDTEIGLVGMSEMLWGNAPNAS